MRPILRIAAIVLVFSTPTQLSFAGQKNDEAAALVTRASNLSDIRADGAPAFVLRASLKLTNEDGSIVEGTYTEYWKSNEQWRKEFVVGDFRRTQIAVGRRDWILDSSGNVPHALRQLGAPFDLSLLRRSWRAGRLRDQTIEGTAARCLRTKGDPWGSSEFCFAKDTGFLLVTTFPLNLNGRTTDSECLYRNYQKLGEHWIPTSYECREGKATIAAKLAEFSLRPEMEQSLFARPAGSRESSRCPTQAQPPKLIHQVEPAWVGKSEGVVTLSLVVGVDGNTRDIKVVDSLDPSSDKSALDAIRQWRFTPAICAGEPFEAEIAVEIDMHGYGH